MLPKNVKVVAIVSPKGGSGKTTTTANLAVALSEFKKYILALDTNVTTASLGLHLNISHPPVTFEDVLSKDFSILNAIYFYNKHLQVIPTALSIELRYKPMLLQEKITQLTNQYDIILSELVNRYDLVIIDTAPGFNAESIAAMQAADSLLMVTNPEVPAIMVAAKGIEYAKLLNRQVVGVILNKVTGKWYEVSKEEVEESLGVKVLAEIPLDMKVPESIANKTPVVSYAPKSHASIAFKKLGAGLIGERFEISFWDKIKSFFKL